MNLSAVAIRRPVFTVMLGVAILVLGLMGFRRLGSDLFPDVSFPLVVVTVPYPGASPSEVEGLVIKPGETVVLRPGSFHLMLMDIKETPVLGKPFKGTLVFEKAGKVEVEFKVEPFGTRTPGGVPKGSDEATGHGGHGKPAPGHGSGQHQKH